jgi:hypothetical protein
MGTEMNTAMRCARMLALVAWAFSLHATATRIDLNPTVTDTFVGSTFSVDVVISGLDGLSPSLAVTDFDLDISFDPARVQATGVGFGTGLGNPADIDGFDYLSTPGIVDLFAISFLDYDSLRALQGSSFTLATLTFLALGPPGTSSLEFVQGLSFIVDLINGAGQDPVNSADPQSCEALSCIGVGGARVVVRERGTVPEPNPLLLFGAGALALAVARRVRAASR